MDKLPNSRATPGRFIKRFLPRGLFGRSLIIIVAPVVLLQGVVTYVFFERDLDTTTRRLARDVAADVALLATLEDSTPTLERDGLRALAARQLRYRLTFHDGDKLAPPTAAARPAPSTWRWTTSSRSRSGRAAISTTSRIGNDFDIKVDVKDGVLEMLVPRDRVTVSQPDIFILWMVGSALILLAIAILFLRNQVRPIERLARAAEVFGKGRPVPDFKPYGATEVRRAAQAFITMRERIERHVSQRTEMLAGVSHDLKTPLTRMKLALAMMPRRRRHRSACEADIAEMEHMLDDYLDFARGEGGEESGGHRSGRTGARYRGGGGQARARPTTIARPSTAPEHRAAQRQARGAAPLPHQSGRQCAEAWPPGRGDVAARRTLVPRSWWRMTARAFPKARREEAFRPFHRLDEGRNLQSGGSGLGLAIARDIARAHGGDIVLDKSALGGLKATIRLPV